MWTWSPSPGAHRQLPDSQPSVGPVNRSTTASGSAGGAVEIAPAGEIDVDTAYGIREAVAAQLAGARPGRIELNLEHVTFIDSVGITALVSAAQLARVSGVELVVIRPSRFVYRQLWITGLLGLFGSPEPWHADEPVASRR
jgi:anti-sigma B factor antagonist